MHPHSLATNRLSRGARWFALVVALVVGMPGNALAQAAVQPAARSGAWTAGSTWASGQVPGMFAKVLIPAGLTVTIPAGALVDSVYGNGGQISVEGTLVVSGKLQVGQLMMEKSGVLKIEATGYLALTGASFLEGSVVNRGTFMNSAASLLNYGPFTNEAGATFDTRGEFHTNSSAPFTNRGVLVNRSLFYLYAPLENHGSFTNTPYGSVFVKRIFNNRPGATFTNNGSFETDGCCRVTNDGAIVNQGSNFTNQSEFINTCTGTLSGQPISGKAPVLECATGVAATPPPTTSAVPTTWNRVAAPTAIQSISAGSAAAAVATTVRATDGNYYLLDGSSGSFAHLQPKVALLQSSRASDGSWWGVTANDGIVRLQSGYWVTVPGQLRQISVGSAQEVWGVNASNVAYRWVGGSWSRVSPAAIKHVSAAADGTVWAISATNAILRWNGSSFDTVPGEAVQVSAGRADNVWVVNAGGTVYRWNGSGWDAMAGAGACKAVAAGADGSVYVLRSADSAVYRRTP